jgi:hypothetical protein
VEVDSSIHRVHFGLSFYESDSICLESVRAKESSHVSRKWFGLAGSPRAPPLAAAAAAAVPPPPPPPPQIPQDVASLSSGVPCSMNTSTSDKSSSYGFGNVLFYSPSSPAPAALTDEQRLHEIVVQQSSSGVFPVSLELARHLGLDSIKAIKDKLPDALSTVSDEIWMTVLVCVFLEAKLASEKEAWELVVEKAWTYVGSRVNTVQMEELKKAAANVIAT